MSRIYQWANPVRTGAVTGPTPAERTHTPDPAAVARLKALLAEQAAARPAPTPHCRDDRGDLLANHTAALRARNARQRVEASGGRPAGTTEARPATARPPATSRLPREPRWQKLPDATLYALHARHVAGLTVMELAAEAGVKRTTLVTGFARLRLKVVQHPRRPRRTFSAEELAAVATARQEGKSWKVLAAEVRADRETLQNALLRAGYEVDKGTPSDRPRLDVATIHALHARHAAGESIPALATATGLRRGTIYEAFRRHDLPVVQHQHGRLRRDFSAEELAAAVAAHEAGKLWREVATEMDVSRQTLREALRRATEEVGDGPV